MLIDFTDKGLYCSQGNFYIDPWLPVENAVITHAHSDHARGGNKNYLCHALTKIILSARLGQNNYQAVNWNEQVTINNVTISFHPAGHIIGSSQIRLSYKGEIWVVSGDYKLENDTISEAFEPIFCHTFITESTFGLPIYDWLPQEAIYQDIREWVKKNQSENLTSVLFAYSLGKSQRLLHPLSQLGTTIYVHGAVWNIHQALVSSGVGLPAVERITPDTAPEKLKGAVVLAPSSAAHSPWMKKFNPYKTGVCSGWMQVRGNIRRVNTDRGFALSDHADWKGLLSAVQATGASRVFVTHGFQAALSKYLNEHGIEAAEVNTEFGGDEEEKLLAESDGIKQGEP